MRRGLKRTGLAAMALGMAMMMTAAAAFAEEVAEQESGGIAKVESERLTGGWNASEDPAVTEELQQVFDEAMKGLLGVDYEAIAYLGSQVVAGLNHCFLCRATVVYPGAEPYYSLVYVYETLDGSASLLNIVALDVTEPEGLIVAEADTADGDMEEDADGNNAAEEMETDADAGEENATGTLGAALLGAWELPEDISVSEEAAEAFARATEPLLGVDYTPVATLATQLVSGQNLCLLSQATVVVPDAVPYYALVYLYVDLEDNAKVTDVIELDLAALPQAAQVEETDAAVR